MSLSFSTKPQKKYYSYTSDGCIYSISSSAPEKIEENGGVWHCYFKCTPYVKVGEKTYLLYIKNGDTYEEAPSFYCGETYYYQENTSVYQQYNLKTNGYYTKNGTTKYSCPQSALELPHVTYTYENGTIATYYFDTLIGAGDKYTDGVSTEISDLSSRVSAAVNTNGVFTALKITTDTTYGTLLLDKVKNSISLNAFIYGVTNLPEYLRGNDLAKQYSIINDTIEYTVPAKYFMVYGKLFVEKLNEYMKGYGDSMIAKYADSATTQLEITDNVSDAGVGTLTTSPKN